MMTSDTRHERLDDLLAHYRTRQRRYLTIAISMVLVGAVSLSVAIRISSILLGVAGFLLLAAGLLPVNDRIRVETERNPRLWLLLGTGFLFVAVNFVWVAVVGEWPWFAALGVLFGVLGLLPFGTYLRLNSAKSGAQLTIIGLGLVALGVVDVMAGLNWLVVVTFIVVGISAYRTGLTGLIKSQDAAIGGALAGAVLLGWGTISVVAAVVTSNPILLAGGLLLGTLALHLLSVALTSDVAKCWKEHSVGWKQIARPARIVSAVALVATFAYIVTWGDQPLGVGFALSFAVASIGAAFVWRGEAILLVLVFGFVIVWVSLDRNVPGPEAAEEGSVRIVAIGDSYMSGEGAPAFYEDTNVAGRSANQCRRAPTAYPVLVADALDVDLQFLACSGAKARELYVEGQMENATDAAPGRLPQLDYVDFDENIKFVLVSIGGNDAGFGAVGKGCLLPGSCSDLEENWIKNTDSLGEKLFAAYQEIRTRAGVDTPVIAVPYPIMLTEQGCKEVMLTDEEHKFIIRFVNAINAQVALAAKQAGINFFDAGVDAFAGDRICDDGELSPAAVNFISIQPTEGPFLDRLNPTNWMHNSLHPNPSGHAMYAAALVTWLEDTQPKSNPEPDPQATLTQITIQAEPADVGADISELPDETEWRNEQLAKAAREAWPAAVILFFGGWLFAATGNGGPFRRWNWTTHKDLSR